MNREEYYQGLFWSKQIYLDLLYAGTPHIYPETRQIKRAELRELQREKASMKKRAARKNKRLPESNTVGNN
jgi:hypothetical protein